LSGIRQNLRNFKKRFRTFRRRGEGCLVVVSSPKGEDSPIGDAFAESCKGHWTLRCLECQGLSMPSHRVSNLQWELTDKGRVVPDSIRLECPSCGQAHEEEHAVLMNEEGEYIDQEPEVTWSVGCQWGALASPRVFSWTEIAEAQLAAGRSADARAQGNFDNSWRGLPFRPRKARRPEVDTVKLHRAPVPPVAKLAGIFLAADTQDSGWWWLVRGVDAQRNTYLLAYGFVKLIDELEAVWNAEYLGQQCDMGIIDEGGHGERPKQTISLVERTRGLYTYKGNSRIGERWKPGKERDLILANPYQYQADLLYYIHSQTERGNNYWFLPEDVSDEYIEQIASFRADNKRKHGDRYENWAATGPDHYFDCEKMWLVMLDYATKHMRSWRFACDWALAKTPKEARKSMVEMASI